VIGAPARERAGASRRVHRAGPPSAPSPVHVQRGVHTDSAINRALSALINGGKTDATAVQRLVQTLADIPGVAEVLDGRPQPASSRTPSRCARQQRGLAALTASSAYSHLTRVEVITYKDLIDGAQRSLSLSQASYDVPVSGRRS